MAPGSAFHGLIQATIAKLVGNWLAERGGPCRVLTECAVIPRLHSDLNVRVPDVVVTCLPLSAGQIAIEPTVLIEILSPSNSGSTWTNVWAYTTIPAVKEIVIVQSTRIEVQLLRPSADRIWPERPEMLGARDRLQIESIGFECLVRDIYSDTPLV